jgi:hypothetical protein
MYCGQKLTESGSSAQADTFTQSFTPQTDDSPSGVGSTDAPAGPEPPPPEVGGYRIVKLLGAGGMGAVYEAEAPGSGAHVAVKLLSSRLAANPSSVERFRQEGRLASQLAHPRCVFVLAADTENGRPYIVMELMPGRTLKDLVDERGPLAPHEAIGRVLDVIDGLAEAHRIGMIHRDVKPSNCFLTADDRVKVGDFGLSKSLAGAGGNHLTQTGTFLGTVLFASPEQIRGEPLNYSSDVYSVSATLYFLLCGEAPFQHESAAAALARAISDPPPRIRKKRKDVSVRLERVVMKGLERDRARRWQTLDELREALVDLLPERQRPARPRALVGAYVLDVLLVMFLTVPLKVIAHKLFGGVRIDPSGVGIDLLGWGFAVIYFALWEGLYGTTPGKALLGLRVSLVGRVDPPGVGHAALRAVVFALIWVWILDGAAIAVRLVAAGAKAVGGGFTLFALGTGFAALAVQLRRRWKYRGLHDFASGCQVTQKPLPARKLRLVIHQPTPLQTLLPPALAPLPEVVGGFVVRGRLAVESNGEQVWSAEDRALGREVLLWLRPWGSVAGADPARPTRLRRLGAGTVGWNGTAYDWTAYSAPLGGPLAEAIRPGYPLPWADARYLLEQLVDEFRTAEADGSLPPRLALDHIWVEPNGRVQVLDFPLCEARYRPHEPLAVLREVASLALEGHPRATGSGASAPLPAHAGPVLERLFAADVSLAEFQKDLAETHPHQPEVTPAARAAHLGLEAVALAPALAILYMFAFTISVWVVLASDLEAEFATRTVEILSDKEQRAKVLPTGDRELDRELEAAAAHPRARVRAAELAARARASAEMRRGSLFLPQQRMVEQLEHTEPLTRARNDSALAVREIVLWAGERDRSRGRSESPFGNWGPTVVTVFLVIGAVTVLLAAVFRGGLSLVLAGITLVRADGRRAYRRQCAVRALVVWLPVFGALFGSTLLQLYAPEAAYLSAALFLGAVALLPVYAVLALRFPSQPPQDRLLGTYLVPM